MKFIRTFTVPAKHDCMLCLQNEKETLKERTWTDVKKLREKQNHCTEEADKHLNTYLFNLLCSWSEHLKGKLNNVPLSIKKISCEMFKIRYRGKKRWYKKGYTFSWNKTSLHWCHIQWQNFILKVVVYFYGPSRFVHNWQPSIKKNCCLKLVETVL